MLPRPLEDADDGFGGYPTAGLVRSFFPLPGLQILEVIPFGWQLLLRVVGQNTPRCCDLCLYGIDNTSYCLFFPEGTSWVSVDPVYYDAGLLKTPVKLALLEAFEDR